MCSRAFWNVFGLSLFTEECLVALELSWLQRCLSPPGTRDRLFFLVLETRLPLGCVTAPCPFEQRSTVPRPAARAGVLQNLPALPSMTILFSVAPIRLGRLSASVRPFPRPLCPPLFPGPRLLFDLPRHFLYISILNKESLLCFYIFPSPTRPCPDID